MFILFLASFLLSGTIFVMSLGQYRNENQVSKFSPFSFFFYFWDIIVYENITYEISIGGSPVNACSRLIFKPLRVKSLENEQIVLSCEWNLTNSVLQIGLSFICLFFPAM